MRKLWAFLRRDLQVAASYRIGGVFVVTGGVVTLAFFFFLSKTVGDSPLIRARYGSDYFSFALLGVTGAAVLRSLQTRFAARLREAQLDGSLEALLAAPLSTFHAVAGLAAWPIASALLRALALVVAGATLFGAELSVQPLAFALSLLLSLAAFSALGLLSAAFVLTFKRGDPFTYFLDVTSYLLAGVAFPVEVLPTALQWVSRLLPATYALRALRASALGGASPAAPWPSLGVLAVFSVLLWPLAAGALTLARRHVERAGTLPHA